MKNKVLPVSVLVLFMLMCINACGISKSRDSADMVSELNNRIIEKVAENYALMHISINNTRTETGKTLFFILPILVLISFWHIFYFNVQDMILQSV
jgi:hypothetical protein